MEGANVVTLAVVAFIIIFGIFKKCIKIAVKLAVIAVLVILVLRYVM